MKGREIEEITPIADISGYTAGYAIKSVQVGHDQRIYVLLADHIPERIQGMFVQTRTARKQDYKVLIIDGDDGGIVETLIGSYAFNYHFVQPLDNGDLLLAGARTRRLSDQEYERNGLVLNADGVRLGEILLGDGIQDLQVTRCGTIWTSFFDEGVFGNYGWDHPVGSSGLIAWDRTGRAVYRNDKADICDCYALNVVHDDEVWFYYYTDFYLGKIAQGQTEFYQPALSGASGFALWRNLFLFDGGYGKHDEYVLMKQSRSGAMKKVRKLQLSKPDGERIRACQRDFRGDTIILVEDQMIYRLRLRDLKE